VGQDASGHRRGLGREIEHPDAREGRRAGFGHRRRSTEGVGAGPRGGSRLVRTGSPRKEGDPMSADRPHLLVEKSDGILTLTMNRPEAKNALSPEMLVRMAEAWYEFRDSS